MEPAAAANSRRTTSDLHVTSDRRLRQNDDGPNVRVGRLQLGRRQSTRYVTQYSIDTRRQLSHINDEILSDDCIPFRHCPRSRRCAAVVWFWSFIRSETFIYVLHISSIALGAINDGLF